MNKNTIEVWVVISDGQPLLLELSPAEYKQQFREFVRQNALSYQQAFQLKTYIQMKLVQASKLGLRQGDNTEKIQLPDTLNQVDKQKQNPLQSPENNNAKAMNYKGEQSQISTEVFNEVHKNIQSMEKLPTFTTFCLQKQNSQPQKERESQQQSIEEELFAKQLNVKYAKKINYAHPKLQKQSIPYQRRNRSPSEQVFGRLYHNGTVSFKNKKNKEVNRQEELDYLQVQKYQLNNSLKRTTNRFFSELSHNHTLAFSKKTAKHKKQLEDLQPKQSPYVSPPHSRKASPYLGVAKKQSGSRCEMKEYIKKRENQIALTKAKEVNIRKRMKEQSTRNNSNEQSRSQSPPHKSCQKCHPKVEVKPQRRKSKKEIVSHKSRGRPYVSNLLQECYNEFVSDLQKL